MKNRLMLLAFAVIISITIASCGSSGGSSAPTPGNSTSSITVSAK